MLRDAKEFKKAMLEAKHELELELSPPDDAADADHGDGHADVRARPAPPRLPPHARDPGAVGGGRRPDGPGAAHPTTSRRPSRGSTNLRDQGLITPEEYEAKKAELLSRL